MLLALSLVLAVVAAAAAAPPSSAPAAPLRLPRSDPSEQLQHDLNAAIAAGSSSFAISPGVYRPKGDLFLNNARDLSVASGSGGRRAAPDCYTDVRRGGGSNCSRAPLKDC